MLSLTSLPIEIFDFIRSFLPRRDRKNLGYSCRQIREFDLRLGEKSFREVVIFSTPCKYSTPPNKKSKTAGYMIAINIDTGLGLGFERRPDNWFMANTYFCKLLKKSISDGIYLVCSSCTEEGVDMISDLLGSIRYRILRINLPSRIDFSRQIIRTILKRRNLKGSEMFFEWKLFEADAGQICQLLLEVPINIRVDLPSDRKFPPKSYYDAQRGSNRWKAEDEALLHLIAKTNGFMAINNVIVSGGAILKAMESYPEMGGGAKGQHASLSTPKYCFDEFQQLIRGDSRFRRTGKRNELTIMAMGKQQIALFEDEKEERRTTTNIQILSLHIYKYA